MKSILKKFHASKYMFRTHVIRGNGNVKGQLVVGSKAALSHIEQALGRKLEVVKTDHTKTEWVFCEKRGANDGSCGSLIYDRHDHKWL